MSAIVSATYGLEMSSPSTSMRTARPFQPSAMRSAERYWLETSPRTRTTPARSGAGGAIASGGNPFAPR